MAIRFLSMMILSIFLLASQVSAASLKIYRDDINHFSIQLLKGTSVFKKDSSSNYGDMVMLAAKKGGVLSHSNIPATMLLISKVEFEQLDDEGLNALSAKYDDIVSEGVEGIDWVRIEKKEFYQLPQGKSLFAKSLVMIPDKARNVYAHCYHFILGQNRKLYQIFYVIPAEKEKKYESQVFESVQSFKIDIDGRN